MGFSISYGEKYIIVSGSERILERVYQKKPVWSFHDHHERIKTFNSEAAGNNFIIKNDLDQVELIQVKSRYKPVYNIHFKYVDIDDVNTVGEAIVLRIECYMSWTDRSQPNKKTQYDNKDDAQKALDRHKLTLIQDYQNLIMYCKDLKLPEFI